MKYSSNIYRLLLLLPLLFFSLFTAAQETVVKGRVTDAATNEAIPFANIRFKGTTSGTPTDFDGYYTVSSLKPVDSLTAGYLGYFDRTKKVKRGTTQTIDFQLQPNIKGLKEVVVVAGENPALRIIRAAIANRELYNKRSLTAYQYESYSKIQIDVDNVSDNIRKRKVLKPVISIFDTLKAAAGEEGKANFPVFFSETISDIYFTSTPFERKCELIKASKVTGVGIKNGELTSQFAGSTFEQYNFNDNKLFLFGKEFLSPIADAGLLFYEYYLLDSTFVDGFRCYKIRCKPKNDQDLAFTGNIWITDSSFALKQANVEIPKSANLNFIERVQVQIEMRPTQAGAWFPSKTRSVINVADVSKKLASLIFKSYFSAKTLIVNQPKDYLFYDKQIELDENALRKDNAFWDTVRHERLTDKDRQVHRMIDTVKNIPMVRTTTDIFYTLLFGHYTVGKIDLGPYNTLYGFNTVQGHRLRLGFRTNIDFSDRLILRGYLSVGTRSQQLFYNGQIEYFLSRNSWSKMGIQRRDDIDQVGFQFDFDDNPAFNNEQSALYNISSQISRFSLLQRKTENRFWIEANYPRSFTPRLTLQNVDYKHYFKVGFEHSTNSNTLQKDFNTTEVQVDLRYAPKEHYVQKDNRRFTLGADNRPVTILTYTQGVKGVMNSDFNYSKLALSMRHRIRLGVLGFAIYTIKAGKTFSKIPYTLLEVHRGNQTPFAARGTYNLMNYFEFVSDQFAEVNYQHHFNGLIFNRVPLLRKLKLREVASAAAVYGNLSKVNSDFNRNNQFNTLVKKPYIEAGFGIENIFRFVRVDFLYRLSYTDKEYQAAYRDLQVAQGVAHPYTINPFGVKFSVFFTF